ncbi:dna repair protein [Qipengyuania citrea LAMA 915]|uniref:Dna repair protein n=1 Tax=Qipengyuania citrea LAMA 915 TaxID=1306953 RepID=A0A0L1KAA6_9SPHN|nr:dna repair protein [Qipengyuania citrea LAMA 915]
MWSYNQYRRVPQHFLGSVVEHGLAVLDPAMSAERIASDAYNNMGVDTAPGQPQR